MLFVLYIHDILKYLSSNYCLFWVEPWLFDNFAYPNTNVKKTSVNECIVIATYKLR